MPRTLPRILLLAVATALIAAPTASARPHCTAGSGPRCFTWYGKVSLVADGDTIDVDVYGDGTRERRRIRLTGLNAPELRRYSRRRSRRRGECHAVAAANRLETLIRHWHRRGRLRGPHRPSHSGSRLRPQG